MTSVPLNRRHLVFSLVVMLTAQVLANAFLHARLGWVDRQGLLRGRDFLQFYTAGHIVAQGAAKRLYDQEFFAEVQRASVPIEFDIPYYSLYPPTLALVFALPARLPYLPALFCWCLVQAACLAFTFWGMSALADTARDRFVVVLVALGFSPLSFSLIHGQLAPLLMAQLWFGFDLVRRERRLAAGLVFSLLAVKPQLFVGLAIWLALHRDRRLILATAGGITAQLALTSAVLGPHVWSAYAETVLGYGALLGSLRIAPSHQHGLASALAAVLDPSWRVALIAAHLAVAATACVFLIRIMRAAGRPPTVVVTRREAAAAILFVLIVPPHLVTYDLLLLLPAVFLLWFDSETSTWTVSRTISAVLYVSAMVLPAIDSLPISPIPFILLWSLWALAHGGIVENRSSETRELPGDP